MKLPSTNPITLGYGATTEPYSPATPHNGTDFAYIPDDTIYAPCDGLVSLVPNNGNDGNGVYMHDPQGRFHGLLHTSRYLVPNNVSVKEGQAIAVMGNTGFAQGTHLHWCVKENNKFIDPMSLIKQTKGEDMQPWNRGDLTNLYKALHDGNSPTAAELDTLEGFVKNDKDSLLYSTIIGRINQLAAAANKPPEGFKPLGKEVFVKE